MAVSRRRIAVWSQATHQIISLARESCSCTILLTEAIVRLAAPFTMNNATVVAICEEVVAKEAADLRKVGNRLPFVLPAYALVFGVCGFAAAYDFIASKWRTAGSRRRGGKAHLCLLRVPMAYMLAYIIFQHHAQDYKEMSGGIIALCFAFADFARTVMGLWQLHVFCHWAVASIRSLESLGYVAEENDEDVFPAREMDKGLTLRNAFWHWVADRGLVLLDKFGHSIFVSIQSVWYLGRDEDGRLFRTADSLKVNDLLLDNRLTDRVRYPGAQWRGKKDPDSSHVRLDTEVLLYLSLPVFTLCHLEYNEAKFYISGILLASGTTRG